MTTEPETRYAIADGFHIAYQVVGQATPKLLMVPGMFSHLEMQWRLPSYRRFMRALARQCCLIRFDKRGTGLSDPVAEVPGVMQRMTEVQAVMDATGFQLGAVLGFSEGGPIAMQVAANYPERVAALILYGSYARKPPTAVIQRLLELGTRWGSGETFALFAPGVRSQGIKDFAGAIERASASPSMYRALVESLALTDVHQLLPLINVPTLVLHRRQEYIPIDEARFVAGGIRGARLVEFDGVDHHPWAGDWRPVVDEILTFLDDVVSHEPLAAAPAARRRAPQRTPARRPAHGWASLTPAEVAVIELVIEGLSNRAIAERLVISRFTVETHLKHAFGKLDVASRAELVSQAALRVTRPG